MRHLRNYILCMVAAFSLIVMPSLARAAGDLDCDGTGNPVPQTELFDADPQNNGGFCEFQGIQHIFSQIVCDFTQVLNDVLSQVYCGIQFALLDTLKIVLTLYMAIFGFQMLVGTAQLNSKEVLTRLLKIAAVWTFATESTYAIGIIFDFFIAVMTDASSWVINALAPHYGGNLCNNAAIPFGANDDIMELFSFFDTLIYCAIAGPASASNMKVISFFLAMCLVYPPMFMLATWWAWATFKAITRAVISFMMCMAAIAFLVALTPIFLSLMLFQVTNHFFENWIRYLIAYSIQVVIVFGVIVLWIIITVQFISFFTNLSNLIFPYLPTMIPGPLYDPTDTWAICPPSYSEDPLTNEPTAVCRNGFDANPPECDQTGVCIPPNNPAWEDDAAQLIPPPRIVAQPEFLYYVFYHLITLILITYTFSVLLEMAPKVAQAIAGPSPLPVILGGIGNSGFGSTSGQQLPQMLRGGQGTASQNVSTHIGNLTGDR